jgi:WD40 repeat protein
VRNIIAIMLFSLFAWGVQEITPVSSIEINGTAKDMVLDGEKLLIATDMGHIEVYDITTNKKIQEVSIPDVKDFMGEVMPARVMSTDMIGEKYLLLSDSGIGGYANLYIYENGKTVQLITHEDKKPLIKARFIDENHIFFAYLSDEVALYDIAAKKELYRVQMSESKFSDFALNEKKTEAVTSCESGVLSVIDVKSGKILKELKGQNVDNVYRVDFKNGMVSGAGQDQRGSLYDVKSGKGEYIKGSFLIYSTALSPSASKVAFAMDEKNNISIFNTMTKSKTALLKGQKSTLNVIIFKDENRLYSASDDNTVMVWDLMK